MLQDALLMIAIHTCRDEGLLKFLEDQKIDLLKGRIEVYDDIPETQRKVLYEECKQISDFPKLIITKGLPLSGYRS